MGLSEYNNTYLLTVLGKTFTGCNVENAAYGLCICAEKTAIVKAVSSNEMIITAIAVCAEIKGDENVKGPCGSCRQFLAEFVTDFDVLFYSCLPNRKKILEISIADLLPLAFNF